MFEPFIIDTQKKDIYKREYYRWSNSSSSTDEEASSFSSENSSSEEVSESGMLFHILEKEKEYIHRNVSYSTKRNVAK